MEQALSAEVWFGLVLLGSREPGAELARAVIFCELWNSIIPCLSKWALSYPKQQNNRERFELGTLYFQIMGRFRSKLKYERVLALFS